MLSLRLGHTGGDYSGRNIMNLFTDMLSDMYLILKELHAKDKKFGIAKSTESS